MHEGLSESLEDYLEVILALEKINKVARVKDIAEKMGIQAASVSGALKNLAERKLINYEPYSYITLTTQGYAIAREVTHRHRVIKDFLMRVLQIDPITAENSACRMEHAIDKASLERLVQFISFIDNCPRTGENWIQSFVRFCSAGQADQALCERCIQDIQTQVDSEGNRLSQEF